MNKNTGSAADNSGKLTTAKTFPRYAKLWTHKNGEKRGPKIIRTLYGKYSAPNLTKQPDLAQETTASRVGIASTVQEPDRSTQTATCPKIENHSIPVSIMSSTFFSTPEKSTISVANSGENSTLPVIIEIKNGAAMDHQHESYTENYSTVSGSGSSQSLKTPPALSGGAYPPSDTASAQSHGKGKQALYSETAHRQSSSEIKIRALVRSGNKHLKELSFEIEKVDNKSKTNSGDKSSTTKRVSYKWDTRESGFDYDFDSAVTAPMNHFPTLSSNFELNIPGSYLTDSWKARKSQAKTTAPTKSLSFVRIASLKEINSFVNSGVDVDESNDLGQTFFSETNGNSGLWAIVETLENQISKIGFFFNRADGYTQENADNTSLKQDNKTTSKVSVPLRSNNTLSNPLIGGAFTAHHSNQNNILSSPQFNWEALEEGRLYSNGKSRGFNKDTFRRIFGKKGPSSRTYTSARESQSGLERNSVRPKNKLSPLVEEEFDYSEANHCADQEMKIKLEGTVTIKAQKQSYPNSQRISGNMYAQMNGFKSEVSYVPPETSLPPLSLLTIDKSLAVKTYIETYYDNLLNNATPWSHRKALFEKYLNSLDVQETRKERLRLCWMKNERENTRLKRKRLTLTQFENISIIGHGAFGVVHLVKEHESGSIYALKRLRKSHIIRMGYEAQVKAERDIMVKATSYTRWCVSLKYAFQDNDNLYLVMPYMPGGDLLGLLIATGRLKESWARFYVAEMIMALDEAHNVLNIMHRDLKPDNFLFDEKGHLLLGDFGLATDFHWSHENAYYNEQKLALLEKTRFYNKLNKEEKEYYADSPRNLQNLQHTTYSGNSEPALDWRRTHRRKQAHTVVGTTGYMAVEVVKGEGYNESCDYWSLGVIMYEMIYGYPPFYSKERKDTVKKIINWDTHVRFPLLADASTPISAAALDLMKHLICLKEDRVGCSPGSNKVNIEKVKSHPWFIGIDFDCLSLAKPPFCPRLSTPDDTKYFDATMEAVSSDVYPYNSNASAENSRAAKDPMLRSEQGAAIMESRKKRAFMGWEYSRPLNCASDYLPSI